MFGMFFIVNSNIRIPGKRIQLFICIHEFEEIPHMIRKANMSSSLEATNEREFYPKKVKNVTKSMSVTETNACKSTFSPFFSAKFMEQFILMGLKFRSSVVLFSVFAYLKISNQFSG